MTDDLTLPAFLDRRGRSLDDYDPTEGLKGIAVAEAAEIMFARAKDAVGLYEAIEVKLSEQRRFVIWWDGQNLNALGNATIADRRQYPDNSTLHRWRSRLKGEDKFYKALEAAKERCRRVCEAEKGSTEQKGASGTGENDWHTPDKYLEAARAVLGNFDLDPASSDAAQKRVQAATYFTPADDGLAQDWGGIVWLNPPYAQPLIAQFVSKMVSEFTAGRVTAAIMLTHNYTDTAWFHEAAAVASAICFTRGRVQFINANGEVAAPTQGQAFFYFGADVEEFASRFREIGFVMAPLVGA